MGGPNRFSGHPVFLVDFNQISPNRVSVRGQDSDPLTTSLKVGGAIKSTPRDLRMIGAVGELQVPLLSKDYEVWAFAGSLTEADGNHYWRMGIRLGPSAGGGGSTAAESVHCAPPAFRGASLRDLMAVLSVPGQVGYPPTMGLGASLGFP